MNSDILIPTIEQIAALTKRDHQVSEIKDLQIAHELSADIHQDRKRASGESYVEHDRVVSWHLATIGFDSMTTLAGLVHDVLLEEFYDSDRNYARLRQIMGDGVSELVHGVNRLMPYTKLLGKKDDPVQLEKLRRAILNSIDDDIRVLVIRVADNLTDLKFANRLPDPDMKKVVAREAAEIYAPIANRLGMWHMKWQLEDLSFRYLNPDTYKYLATQIAEKKQERDARIEQRIAESQKGDV